MDKNIISIIIILVVVVIGAFFAVTEKAAFDISGLEQDSAVLQKLSVDLDILYQDQSLLEELDRTINDILDESVATNASTALNEASIVAEESQAELSQTLNAFADDEEVFGELNQLFNEVSQ